MDSGITMSVNECERLALDAIQALTLEDCVCTVRSTGSRGDAMLVYAMYLAKCWKDRRANKRLRMPVPAAASVRGAELGVKVVTYSDLVCGNAFDVSSDLAYVVTWTVYEPSEHNSGMCWVPRQFTRELFFGNSAFYARARSLCDW